MPDWTSIPNSALAVGAPPRAADAVALRDNPAAMARGAPDAPRISPWAMATTIAAGTVVVYEAPTITHTTQAWQTRISERLLNEGSIQFAFSLRRTSGGGAIRVQAYRLSGSTLTAMGAEATAGGTLVEHTRTITGLSYGDSVQLHVRMQDADATGDITLFRMRTTGTLLTPVASRFVYGPVPT